MRVLLDTNANPRTSAAAREWFYEMSPLLRKQGIDVELNVLGGREFDVALIHWARLDRILEVLTHSPRAHIGVLNPGYLGFPQEYVAVGQKRTAHAEDSRLLANVDFFVVSSFMWRDLLLPLGRRVYQVIDYVRDLPRRRTKTHAASNNLTIGYHGNAIHFARDFFPQGAQALARLAKEYDLVLKVITNNVHSQPSISGVKSEGIEWQADTVEGHLQSFDIGICPSFSDLKQLVDPFTFVRNPNRVISLLSYGIPSVTSPVFESCNVLRNEESVLFAVTEEGWYDSLKRLITQPDLRNRIGRTGRMIVEKEFSEAAGVARFRAMFEDEMRQPALAKPGSSDVSGSKRRWWNRIVGASR